MNYSVASLCTKSIGQRQVARISYFKNMHPGAAANELYSHAETCVVDKNALITHSYGNTFTVTGYNPSLGQVTNLDIISSQVAYELPNSSNVVLLNINQCVNVLTMENNILCPMQLRMNGCRLQETPKFQVRDPTENDHSFTINSESGDQKRIPFFLRGVTSYFHTRKPTPGDQANVLYKYNLTAIVPNWDPHDTHYEDQENIYLDQHDRFQIPPKGGYQRLFALCHTEDDPHHHRNQQAVADIHSQCNSVLLDISNTLNNDIFHQALV